MGFIKSALNDLVTSDDAKIYLMFGMMFGAFTTAATYGML